MPTPGLSKIPFLFCGLLCSYISQTAPNPPPPPEERTKYQAANSKQENGPFSVSVATNVFQKTVYALNLLEILAILVAAAERNPSIMRHLLASARGFTLPRILAAARAHLVRAGASVTLRKSFLAAFASMTCGTLFRYLAYRYLGRQFTFQLALRKEHKLVTNGPYTIVRHPSYTGGVLFLCGTAFCQIGPGSYWEAAGMWGTGVGRVCGVAYLAIVAYLIKGMFARMPMEDAILRAEFGEQWDLWAEKTRYRMIPFVY